MRFGLRAPDDPRIRNTVSLVDALLRCELPQGPLWYRYTDDGYGEHEDGSPFDGTGQGRAWPLLAGERAHYELAAGRMDVAASLLRTLEDSASDGGMLPEQVWDAEDIPERGLYRGQPTGSAMPLVWAHSEHLKLIRSLNDGRVFDMPPQTVERYQHRKVTASFRAWCYNNRLRSLPVGKKLRIQLQDKALVHWSVDNWASAHDDPVEHVAFGLYTFDMPTEKLPAGSIVRFTLHWTEQDEWQGEDYEVVVN